ncbi:MAG: hypothetical protein ABJA98_17525 [Acidobacteriota bacterium]
MSDERPPWFAAGHKPQGIPRRRKVGQEVWRLRHPDGGRVQSCEIRDDSKVSAGWDCTILENDELVFSRRCVDEAEARYVANALKQDTSAGTGWIE